MNTQLVLVCVWNLIATNLCSVPSTYKIDKGMEREGRGSKGLLNNGEIQSVYKIRQSNEHADEVIVKLNPAKCRAIYIMHAQIRLNSC